MEIRTFVLGALATFASSCGYGGPLATDNNDAAVSATIGSTQWKATITTAAVASRVIGTFTATLVPLSGGATGNLTVTGTFDMGRP